MNISELNFLVVEDDTFQRQLIVSMLRLLGAVTIFETSDGKQALAVLCDPQSKPIDLVICDLHMPVMDGLEFLRHLSQGDHRPAVLIVSLLDSKLLSQADRMAKKYGIRLLGSLRKAITLNALKESLAKYGQVQQERLPTNTANVFSLDEILQGIHDNQFEPFFQPKVDLKSGRLIGAEALARWVHPALGVIAPDAFISLLEQHEQIDELTFDILQKSAAACRLFHDNGHTLTIAVNLSLISLNDATLADQIIQIVRKANIDPHYIVLEITETVAMTEAGHALENLTRLSMHGFVLSIDDYGTGYSSMQQLTRIAFGELKIDQSFVKELSSNEGLCIVVESSIDMAHKLGVKCVAEGVETQLDWDMLKSSGCDIAQGYFIAKPMGYAAFSEFMSSFKQITDTLSLTTIQNKPRILVVDDDNFARSIIVRVLRDLGYTQIMDTDHVAAALKLLDANTFDLIITDVDMPGMNGLEFAHLIRTGQTHAKSNTRIVVLTAFSNTEMLGIGMALDVNGFLVKPVIPTVLDEKITLAMSEKMSLRPPLAYHAVLTELHSSTKGAFKVREEQDAASTGAVVNTPRVGAQCLKPGMVLIENVVAKDGTLLMRTGYVLTEMSINRLDDLSGFLKNNSFAVQA